jgi:hypothetical protein
MTAETTIEIGEIDRAKRALVVLMECFKAAKVEAPLELKQDMQALMGLIRKIEQL